MATKAGAKPWVFDQLPFSDRPGMIIGLHFEKKGNTTIITLIGTMDEWFAKFNYGIEFIQQNFEIEQALYALFTNCIQDFINANQRNDINHIIVYREGTSEGQISNLKNIEVSLILNVFKNLLEKNILKKLPSLFYIMANKRNSSKLYNENPQTRHINNPEPGTVVDDIITSGRDFFLVSQTVFQGTAAPTHYHVVSHYDYNSQNQYVEMNDTVIQSHLPKLELLTYKMCYMYYNYSGAIRLPAPLKYAEVLGSMVSKMENHGNFVKPHNWFEKLKTLFYI